jgi:hypothetical protein
VSESFSVGDMVELLSGRAEPGAQIYFGQEARIIQLSVSFMQLGRPRHLIEMGDTMLLEVDELCLRKKKPPAPREQVSSWENVIVWRPKELAHG